MTYGMAEDNTFHVQFLALGSYSWAWTLAFSGPLGPTLSDQAGLFDDAVAASRIA